MRPTPADLANGIRTALRELSSEVSSSEGQASLRRAMFALRDMRWNEAAFDMLAENHRLEVALRACIEWMTVQENFASLVGATTELVETARAPASFDQARARNLALRGALCEVLDQLVAWDSTTTRTLRQNLVGIMLRRTGG